MKNTVLIGLGMVAPTHARAIVDSQNCNLIGVMSRSETSAQTFISKHCGSVPRPPKIYRTIEAICEDDAVDFVSICTPPDERLALAKPLSNARIPVLMEKPLERTAGAAGEIVKMFADNNTPLGVVFQHRVRAASKKLAEMMAKQQLGQIGLVEVNVPWWRDQSYYDEPGRGSFERDGGGVLISQAIHTLDLMLSLLGDVSSVQSMARTTRLHEVESEDFVVAGVEFENGAVGSIVASTASFPGGAESIRIHGSKATATLQSGTLNVIWRDETPAQSYGDTAQTGSGKDPMAFTHDWHRSIYEDFADALTENRTPLVSGQEALAVHHLIDALVASSSSAKAISMTPGGT